MGINDIYLEKEIGMEKEQQGYKGIHLDKLMVPAEQINKPREQGLKQREASQFCENLDMHNKKKSSQ